MPGILILLLAVGGAVALASKKTAATKPVDPSITPALDAAVKKALASETDPAKLEQLALTAQVAGCTNAAAALKARAAQLRGQISMPGVPPPTPPPTGPFDASMPAAVSAQVTQALKLGTDPAELDQIAAACDVGGFPIAAAAVRARAAQLRGQISVPGIPPPVVPAPPAAPLPSPAPPPIEGLDPNIPPALAASVAAVLAKDTLSADDLSAADALANTCETSGYPIAAAKLRAKALSERAKQAGAGILGQIAQILTAPAAHLPPVPPAPPPDTPPIITIPPAPSPVTPDAAPTPAPLANVYVVLSGDNPSSIAKRYTGDPNRYRELAAANPDKSARILAGKIYVDEVLTLPDAWPSSPVSPGAPAPAPAQGPAISAVGLPTIQQGSTGPAVVQWQSVIGVDGDGIFGPATAAATKAWQTHNGLSADGIVGPATWGAAIAQGAVVTPASVDVGPAATSSAAPNLVTIEQGSTGPAVVAWQMAIGISPADGIFGPATAAATRAWQTQQGLSADGIVGPQTWATVPTGALAALTPGSVAGWGWGSQLAQAVRAAARAHTVGPADTPFRIAKRYTGTGERYLELARANPALASRIRNGILFAGETLRIPDNWPSRASAVGVLDLVGGAHAYRHMWGG